MDAETSRKRVVAGIGAAALQGLLGYALVTGLATVSLPQAMPSLTVFAVPPPPPPRERIVPPRVETGRRAGKAAPPNLRARAAAIVAPPVVILPELPPPVLAALVAGPGADADAGAAPVIGPGTGAGGEGTGTGSGTDGDGDGDGGGTPSRWLRGDIRDSDYPRAAYEARAEGTVGIRFVVGTDGRVGQCVVTRSSGNAALDEATCRLIKQRRRYRAARDRDGRKVPDTYFGESVWRYSEEPTR